jgi:hypothetical protein
VQYDRQQRLIDLNFSVVLDEAWLPEFISGFLVFIFNSKHPGYGLLHINKAGSSETMQNRTAPCVQYPYDNGLYGGKCDRRRNSGLG